MTKDEFKEHFKAMYRVGNRSDTPADEHEEWTKAVMAGRACCRPLDSMAHALVDAGIWSEQERKEVFDCL